VEFIYAAGVGSADAAGRPGPTLSLNFVINIPYTSRDPAARSLRSLDLGLASSLQYRYQRLHLWGHAMNAAQNNKKPDISFTKRTLARISSWSGTAGNAIELQFRRLAFGIKKHAWAVFAVLLAVTIMEFNYYQARLTREYLRVFLVNAAEINGEIDALQAKLNQLNMKIDSLSAKLDKLSLSSSAVQAKPRPSVFSKPR
jgi:hypothetical protein